LAAQRPRITGYYQNVGSAVAGTGGGSGTLADLQRLRLMATPAVGPFVLELALEHTLDWERTDATTSTSGLLASTRAGDDWLGIDWTIHQGRSVVWRQRPDRLNLALSRGAWSVRVGRQAISWGTTLFLTPADPFAPFDPADPFREYRRAVDAVRAQWFPGPRSLVDMVVRPASTPDGTTLTALARGMTTWNGWELSAWGGRVHDAGAFAAGLTRSVGASALRAEGAMRRDSTGAWVFRGAVGLDRRVTVAGRDLYAVLEYQHDGFGAERADQLPAITLSGPARRAELQVLGRDEAATQVTYQLRPLLGLELLTLWNLRDGSGLIAPAASRSLSEEVSARAGVFLPVGTAGPTPAMRGSEYGPQPAGAYVAVSAFF
ncbi:MAG TPA: hypothetical protein VFI13_05535, partial [Gemmatimonadales bacterium]|nr:hypothetical protein [Gemmatimonadales bacterium]